MPCFCLMTYVRSVSWCIRLFVCRTIYVQYVCHTYTLNHLDCLCSRNIVCWYSLPSLNNCFLRYDSSWSTLHIPWLFVCHFMPSMSSIHTLTAIRSWFSWVQTVCRTHTKTSLPSDFVPQMLCIRILVDLCPMGCGFYTEPPLFVN